MSYKIKNLLLCCSFSCLLMVSHNEAFAQGVVTLSEEAMFDDELETNKDFPADQAKAQAGAVIPKGPNAPSSAGAVVPKGPNAPSSAGAVIPKGPNAPSSAGAVVPKGPNAPAPEVVNNESADDAVLDELPALAITDKKTEVKKSAAPSTVAGAGNTAVVDDLFNQMSDIERNTALLNLQLKKEKLQNEIDAVKNQRRLALEQEKQKAEEIKQKQKEKEQEQERLKIQEQQKLRELDIEFEKLRQEKLIKAYKNLMLEEQQKWIAHDALFYKNIADLRNEKKQLLQKHKDDLTGLQQEADNALKAYQRKLESHQAEVNDLNSQIDVLRNRLSNMEQELAESKNNPFAGGQAQSSGASAPTVAGDASTDGSIASSFAGNGDGGASAITAEPVNNSLAKYYAVTEIRGQGGELIAKLINKNGLSFYVKKGTTLQTGHVISEITSTYVAADKNYKKDYIYFSAGGILPEEVDTFKVEKEEEKNNN